MPSPFPGMDPYLESEKLWPAFQHHLVACLHQSLPGGPVDRYRTRVGLRRYSAELALFTSVVREEHEEEFIEIRQRGDSKLVTLIEVVSLANKTTRAGREAYLKARGEARAVQANIVEIDLVIQGQPMLEYSREGLPEWDHAVTVTRATQPERYEIYTATLRKKLPKFRLPLTADDRDPIVDLQAVFTRCFEQGGFAGKIDYHRDPPTRIVPDDRAWIDEMLRLHKIRP